MKLQKDSCIVLPTLKGKLKFEYYTYGDEQMLVVYPNGQDNNINEIPLIRIHSGCIFSEVFGTVDCDCAQQLNLSIDLLMNGRYGYVFYMFQEGRGKGLEFKMRAIQKEQQEGLNTCEAYIDLGSNPDNREYNIVVAFLNERNIFNVELLTNNPTKIEFLEKSGIYVIHSLNYVKPNEYTTTYLESKKQLFNHIIPNENK
jgi:3,4-dihydroxy 2-butanone 4-phosphate synthase/GTP cyclohydrolase II